MDNQNLWARSSEQNPGHDAEDAPREYGVNWPFPPVGGPTPWTAKQIKLYKAKEIQDAEEALL